MSYSCSDCILDMLHASGPQETPDLRRECRTQAVPYTVEAFQAALETLEGSGRIVMEVSDFDGVVSYYYDLPDSYYMSSI